MGDRSLTPASPDLSEPCYDPRGPVCAAPEMEVLPGYFMPSMHESEVVESLPELSQKDAQYVLKLVANVANDLYWQLRVRFCAFRQSLCTQRTQIILVLARLLPCCWAKLTLDEAMAVYSASCIDALGRKGRSSSKGAEKPSLV
eukprot:4598618-Pleurochrysis_carterae.AAC.1